MANRTARFLWRFARPARDPGRERELTFDVEGDPRSATVYLPDPAGRGHPAWILLQGVTVPGRHHEAVRRMGRSLAAAGHLALAPEVPSWTALRVDPRDAEPTVRAALAFLHRRQDVDRQRIGLMGFSVAGTWALEVAAGPLGGDLRAVAALGAYGDFRRAVRATVVGEHDWRGKRYRYTPDPYGRWILAADLLPLLDDDAYGSTDARQVAARALRHLAHTSGRNGAAGNLPVYDPLIEDLRRTVPAGARPAWDLLAPMSDRIVPDPDAGRALADALAEAGRRARPALDPTGRLGGLRTPTIFMHGRADTLIPFTETLRLAAKLPRSTRRSVTITRLVGHSKTSEARELSNPLILIREAWRFARLVRRIVNSLTD